MAFRDRLTDEIARKICEGVARTGLFAPSCAAAGINPRAGHHWMYEGQRCKPGSDSKYATFYTMIQNARAQCNLPIADAARMRAKGGVKMVPKHVRYTDTLGRIHDLPELEMTTNEAGEQVPVMIATWIEPSEGMQKWWLEHQTEEFKPKQEVEITDNTDLTKNPVALAIVNRIEEVRRYKALPGPEIEEAEIVVEVKKNDA